MAQSIYIRVTQYGNAVGPFNIYWDNFLNIVELNVTLDDLLDGHIVSVPDSAQYIVLENQDPCGLNTQFKYIVPLSPTPSPSITPSYSVTPSVSISATPSVSVTPSTSITPSLSVTPSITVTPSFSITPSVSISATPSVSMTVNVKETPDTPELTINNQNCPCDVNNTDGIFILNATTTATGTDNWQITGTGPYAYSLNSSNSIDTIDATTLHGGSYTYRAVVAKNGCLSNAAIAVLRIKDNTSINVKSNKSAVNNGGENVASELRITENGNNNVTTSVATADKHEDVLYLYPNPNKGSFTIAGQLSEVTNGQTVTVEVVNMSGQIIARETVEVTNGQLDKKMNVATEMPAGMYFLRVATQEHSYSLRFNIDK